MRVEILCHIVDIFSFIDGLQAAFLGRGSSSLAIHMSKILVFVRSRVLLSSRYQSWVHIAGVLLIGSL